MSPPLSFPALSRWRLADADSGGAINDGDLEIRGAGWAVLDVGLTFAGRSRWSISLCTYSYLKDGNKLWPGTGIHGPVTESDCVRTIWSTSELLLSFDGWDTTCWAPKIEECR